MQSYINLPYYNHIAHLPHKSTSFHRGPKGTSNHHRDTLIIWKWNDMDTPYKTRAEWATLNVQQPRLERCSTHDVQGGFGAEPVEKMFSIIFQLSPLSRFLDSLHSFINRNVKLQSFRSLRRWRIGAAEAWIQSWVSKCIGGWYWQ